MITIIAKFIGKNNSLGYKTGIEYTLAMEYEDNSGKGRILIEPSYLGSNASPCIYTNMSTFLDNWEGVTKCQ